MILMILKWLKHIFNTVVIIAKIEIFKISAGRNGKAPKANNFSSGTKLNNHIRPKIYIKETEKAYSAKFTTKRIIKLYLKWTLNNPAKSTAGINPRRYPIVGPVK